MEIVYRQLNLKPQAVLLHDGSQFPPVVLAHSFQMKEDYQNAKQLLDKINYREFKWEVCGDFKSFSKFFVRSAGLIYEILVFSFFM